MSTPLRQGALTGTIGTLALGAIGLALAGTTACTAYAPEPYTFHSTFERGRAHANTGCDGCHILGAQTQRDRGAELPAPASDGWVTTIEPACALCHPFSGQSPDPPGREDPRCTDADLASPWYDAERCRYFRAHDTPQDGCQGSGCHSVADVTFAVFNQPVDTSDTGAPTPPQNPHLIAPLVDVFPLEGAHTGLACSTASCHPNGTADTTDVQGKSEYCGSCHTRVGEVQNSPPEFHYVPPRAGWTDDRERDCMACHTRPDATGRMVWPNTWQDNQDNHRFLTPHNTVDDWRIDPPVPRAEPAWKRQCWSCHNTTGTNPPDTQDGTSQDAAPGTISLQFNPALMQRSNCTDGCHGTILGGVPDVHFNGANQMCWDAICHATAGPTDLPFN